jgi:hypothetical protein
MKKIRNSICFVVSVCGIFFLWSRPNQSEIYRSEHWGINAPSADFCRICACEALHAPCLLEVSTGTVTELEIYKKAGAAGNELSQIQPMNVSIFHFASNGLPIFTDCNPNLQQTYTYIS